MQQRNIIIFIIILFIASSFWLFRASDKFINPNVGKNWWTIYFVDPNSENLDFVIENHSNQSNFHWQVLANNKSIREKDVNIEKGEVETIKLENIEKQGKIIIRINLGEEKKDIYRNY